MKSYNSENTSSNRNGSASQSSQCTSKAIKIQLSDSRKEAREAALRARGLLPPLAPTGNVSSTTATPEVAPTQSTTASQSGKNASRLIASADERNRETEFIAPPGSPTLSEVSETETLVGVPGVNPIIHTDESIWRLANEIEDEETRRLTMVAYGS
ncbi:hypothetical protein AAF712_000367 [Marasmius tenuissimus]|uniref:Uncharacterized protein n=1 Tax=Marasmius tenuissimus TaxID=585030 RepID=A0ABR3AGZ9_9AGAR|nr:hypothetical protein PM082_001166 [Marasmius tenuissimus]